MKIGGAFPFGQNSIPIYLNQGGACFVPQGNYLLTLGFCTALQYFDPVQLTWRDMFAPGTQGIQIESDGYNFRLVNLSGVVAGCTITAAGSGATNGIGTTATGVGVAIAAPASGQTATAYPIVGGQLAAPTITVAGSGFVVPPLILIDPPPLGGIQATAHATITAGGALSTVVLTNAGAGYTAVPNYYVIPQFGPYPGAIVPPNVPGLTQAAAPPYVPPGLINNVPPMATFMQGLQQALPASGGALVTSGALTGSGTLTGIVMITYGSGYLGTAIPAVTITGAGAATAVALMSMSLQSITITSGGVAYSNQAHIFDSSLGYAETNFGSATIATPGSASAWASQPQNNNQRWLARAARGTATAAGGVITSTQIEDPGFGFQKVPVLGVTQSGGTPATTTATLTAVVGGITDVSVLQPAISA